MPTTRTVYVTSELAGDWELTQPVPVDGSGYVEPVIEDGGTYAYTTEDDAAAALQTDVLTIPATAEVDDVAIVWTAVTDETDTAAVGTAPITSGRNEVQRLTSDRTGGTFTLDDGGAPTGALQALNETAANVQTALEGLAGFGVGQVSCTGGPLDVADILIEFTGTKGAADQANLNVVDSGTGGTAVAISEDTKGVAPVSFTLVGDWNIPQAGDNFQPQMMVWRLTLTAAEPGMTIDVTHADHGTLRSIASGLVIVDHLDLTTPVEVIGGEAAANAALFAEFGSITPLTNGAKVLTLLAKARDGGAGVYYTAADPPLLPSGVVSVHEALADAMSVTLWRSGILDTSAFTHGNTSWDRLALWAAGMLVLKPNAAAAAGASLTAVTNEEDPTTWIDISNAAGSLYEVLELDLASLPTGHVITSANVEIGHSCAVRNAVRLVLVGINPDDTIEACIEQQPSGYVPVPIGEIAEVSTADWDQTAAGTPLSSFNRLGVAVISSVSHPFVEDHRLYWVRSRITYDEGGPVVSNVVGPATPGASITWDYSSDAGLSQTHYQVMVINGSAQDPDAATAAVNPLNPAVGEIVYDSGQVANVLARSLSITDAPLSNGTHTVAVRAWASTTTGQPAVSPWDTADFDISGLPTAPGVQATEPVFNAQTGGVDVEVTVPASVSRAWLLRSEDSGATYQIVEGAPFTVTPLSTQTITDYYAPTSVTTLRYQVTFDAGVMTETDDAVQAGSGADIATPAASWYFRVDDDDSLNTPVFIRNWRSTEVLRTQAALQGASDAEVSRALVASSRPLATVLTLDIWLRSVAERQAVLAVLRSGLAIRISDVQGRVYLMRMVKGQQMVPRRAKGNLSTDHGATGLRDLHVLEGVELMGSVISE